MCVLEGRAIPVTTVAVGVGKSGKAVYTVQAQPTLTLVFNFGRTTTSRRAPSPRGRSCLRAPPTPPRCPTRRGVHDMTVTLRADRTWDTYPTGR